MPGITKIRVSHEDFSINEELQALQTTGVASEFGAAVTFTGYVRSDGEVTAMTLEHYPEMTEKALAKIVEKARVRWSIDDVVIIHRVGRLLVGEQIVLTAVTSSHRLEAFEACHYIMDWLKTRAPFWKKEETATGARWVDAREADDLARDRWGE